MKVSFVGFILFLNQTAIPGWGKSTILSFNASKNKVGSKEYKWSCCSLITKINSVKPERKWMWHLRTSCWPFPFCVCSSSSPLAESFQNIFHITRLIRAAQSSITNIVSDRPDAAIGLSHFLCRRIWGQTTVVSLSDGKQRRQNKQGGDRALHTHH